MQGRRDGSGRTEGRVHASGPWRSGAGGGVQSAKQKEGVKEEQPDYVSWLEEVL